MPTNKLSGEVKAFIVQHLACFEAPSTVAEAVRQQFGATITRQGIEAYDPNKRSGARLSRRWRQLFERTRRAFLEETSMIGISHRAVRLRKLEAQVELNEERGDSAMVAKLLEQAAKEMGGTYQSRRELNSKGARPIEPEPEPDDETLARAILTNLAKEEAARKHRESSIRAQPQAQPSLPPGERKAGLIAQPQAQPSLLLDERERGILAPPQAWSTPPPDEREESVADWLSDWDD